MILTYIRSVPRCMFFG